MFRKTAWPLQKNSSLVDGERKLLKTCFQTATKTCTETAIINIDQQHSSKTDCNKFFVTASGYNLHQRSSIQTVQLF